MTDFLGPGVNETLEDYFTRKENEVGWFNLTEMEKLAIEVIEELRAEVSQAQALCDEMESDRDSFENEASIARDEVEQLEDRISEMEEDDSRNDSTSQDDEVEFLKTLIVDLEEELAAIDAGVVA